MNRIRPIANDRSHPGVRRLLTARQASWQGMNWCRPSTRLAIYLRDGMACAWCGMGVEAGAHLSLDHVQPHSRGGSNKPRNLITACKRCNDSRGARSLLDFAVAVAAYLDHGVSALRILDHVNRTRAKPLTAHRAEALALLKRRGTVAAVLARRRS